MSDSLKLHRLQHACFLHPPLSPGVCSNSCPLSWTINHLILCYPLLLLPSIFLSIRVFSNELAICIMWPKDQSLSFSNNHFNKYSGLISFRIENLISLQAKGLSGVFSSITIEEHQFFGAQFSLWSNSHIHT